MKKIFLVFMISSISLFSQTVSMQFVEKINSIDYMTKFALISFIEQAGGNKNKSFQLFYPDVTKSTVVFPRSPSSYCEKTSIKMTPDVTNGKYIFNAKAELPVYGPAEISDTNEVNMNLIIKSVHSRINLLPEFCIDNTAFSQKIFEVINPPDFSSMIRSFNIEVRGDDVYGIFDLKENYSRIYTKDIKSFTDISIKNIYKADGAKDENLKQYISSFESQVSSWPITINTGKEKPLYTIQHHLSPVREMKTTLLSEYSMDMKSYQQTVSITIIKDNKIIASSSYYGASAHINPEKGAASASEKCGSNTFSDLLNKIISDQFYYK